MHRKCFHLLARKVPLYHLHTLPSKFLLKVPSQEIICTWILISGSASSKVDSTPRIPVYPSTSLVFLILLGEWVLQFWSVSLYVLTFHWPQHVMWPSPISTDLDAVCVHKGKQRRENSCWMINQIITELLWIVAILFNHLLFLHKFC